MEFAIHVSKGFLPSLDSKTPTTGGPGVPLGRKRSGLSSNGESMDTDMDVDDTAAGEGQGNGGTEKGEGEDGLDVTLWKKVAEPIELKRVWKAVMGRLPPGMVNAT